MTETILKVKLEELKTVRVTCTNCGTVVEIPTHKIAKTFEDQHCKHCDRPFVQHTDHTRPHVFGSFQTGLMAMQELEKHDKKVTVEFVIKSPVDDS